MHVINQGDVKHERLKRGRLALLITNLRGVVNTHLAANPLLNVKAPTIFLKQAVHLLTTLYLFKKHKIIYLLKAHSNKTGIHLGYLIFLADKYKSL